MSWEAELPRLTVDTSLVEQTGAQIILKTGDNLQAALDSAQRGDTIYLEPGSEFKGNFKLKPKPGNGWIYVITKDFAGLPGIRVKQTDEPVMAKIRSHSAFPAIQTENRASHWRFIGLEITNSRPDLDCLRIINLQCTVAPKTEEDLPKQIIFDRCSIHGNPGNKVRVGIRQGGAYQATIDSLVYNIIIPGWDACTICDSQGIGPYLTENCYLEATTENIAYGGSNPYFYQRPLADVTIRNCHMFKQLWWKDAPPDQNNRKSLIKNLLEFKHGHRILVEDCLMENNWIGGQVGFAVVMTPTHFANLEGINGIEDVTFRNNIILNSPCALNLLGTGITMPTGRSPSKRQKYTNNWWGLTGGQRLFQLSNNPVEVEVSNNTVMWTGENPLGVSVQLGIENSTDLSIIDNIIPWCRYGVWASKGYLKTLEMWYDAFPPAGSFSDRIKGNSWITDRSSMNLPLPENNTYSKGTQGLLVLVRPKLPEVITDTFEQDNEQIDDDFGQITL